MTQTKRNQYRVNVEITFSYLQVKWFYLDTYSSTLHTNLVVLVTVHEIMDRNDIFTSVRLH